MSGMFINLSSLYEILEMKVKLSKDAVFLAFMMLLYPKSKSIADYGGKFKLLRYHSLVKVSC